MRAVQRYLLGCADNDTKAEHIVKRGMLRMPYCFRLRQIRDGDERFAALTEPLCIDAPARLGCALYAIS